MRLVWYTSKPRPKNIYRILDISDQQNNPVSVESEALPEIELHHQEDINNCDVGNSDSDSSSSASALPPRPAGLLRRGYRLCWRAERR